MKRIQRESATMAISQRSRPALSQFGENLLYPSSDGQPMAENSVHYDWLTKTKDGLELLLKDDPNVLVCGDLLWYRLQGHPEIRVAPDAMVAFGRPKGPRSSYLQWREDGISPQVVFEFISPGNSASEMMKKFEFYDEHGVEEYYIYDPEDLQLTCYYRRGSDLVRIRDTKGLTSPRLGVRFELNPELTIYHPDGTPFQSLLELDRSIREQRELAESEKLKAKLENQRAEAEKLRAESEKQRAEAENEERMKPRQRCRSCLRS
jgi:Uma2 family endonuclease